MGKYVIVIFLNDNAVFYHLTLRYIIIAQAFINDNHCILLGNFECCTLLYMHGASV